MEALVLEGYCDFGGDVDGMRIAFIFHIIILIYFLLIIGEFNRFDFLFFLNKLIKI
jgi:hypothetical protein